MRSKPTTSPWQMKKLDSTKSGTLITATGHPANISRRLAPGAEVLRPIARNDTFTLLQSPHRSSRVI